MVAVALEAAKLPLVLSVDVGTSSTKALVFDRLGNRVVGLEARCAYPDNVTPDGGATFDVERLFDLVVGAIDGVTSRAPQSAGTFGAVAFSAFWHSLTGLNGDGEPVTRLSTWADTSSAPAARALRRRLDERAVHSRTGCMFHPSFWPAKLFWLRKTDKARFSAVSRWASMTDLIALRFTGVFQTSISIASGTGIYDGRLLDWDKELLSALGIRLEQLPGVTDVKEGAGKALHNWRSRWPALSDAAWMPAVGDGACGSLGSGCHRPDRAALMIGTSGALRWILPDSDAPVPLGLFRYRLDRKRIVVGGALSAGGNTHAWLRQHFKPGPGRSLEEGIAELAPNGHGLTILPFFSGDRSPKWRPGATAVIAGLTMESTAEEIALATCEAVAYRFALIEQLASSVTGDYRLIGSGGALDNSPIWARIIADVLQRPVTMSGEEETSSRGAALLALEALKLIESLDEVTTTLGETVEPRPEYRETYRQGFSAHRRLEEKIYGHRGTRTIQD